MSLATKAKEATGKNIIRKIKEGKIPSARELEILEDIEAGNAAGHVGDVNLSRMTRDQCAWVFKVDQKTISRWKKMGAPTVRGRYFDLQEIIEWKVEQEVRRRAGSAAGTGDEEEGNRWLSAFRKERAEIAKLERRKMEGELLPKDQMVAAFVARAFEFGRALLALGRRFSARVAGACKKTAKEVEAIHEKEARKILEDYQRPIEVKGED